MSNLDDDDYRVGKGRTPKHTRFKKGQSGNPSGLRKERVVDAGEAAARVLGGQVPVTQDGTKKKMVGMDALVRKIYAKAISGDMRAAELILRLAANDNARRREGPAPSAFDPANEDLIERFYERYRRRHRDPSTDGQDDHE